jgi:hypothetical protein
MGDVYRARDSRLGRDVAIKVLANIIAEMRLTHAGMRISNACRLTSSCPIDRGDNKLVNVNVGGKSIHVSCHRITIPPRMNWIAIRQ